MNQAFLDRIKAAREAEDKAREMASKPFGQIDITPGIKIVKLQSASAEFSKASQRPQCKREYLILQGEDEGKLHREYQGLESEMGMSIVRRWLSMHGCEFADIFDYTASEAEGQYVYSEDFLRCLNAVEEAEPEYRIEIRKNKSGDREFLNTYILEVLSETNLTPAAPAPAAPVKGIKAPVKAPVKQERENTIEEKLLVFAAGQGITANEDNVKETLAGFCFWKKGTTKKQLKAVGIDAEPKEAEISEDEIDLLDTAELGDCVVCR